MDRPEGFFANLAPGEPAPPASGELFAGHEVTAFESFLDNLATENEFLFHPKVPASLSWNGFHTTKNPGFDEFKHTALQWGSDTHFSPTNGYVATHKYVPVGYGHVHPQSSAQRSRRSSQSSRGASRRMTEYSENGGHGLGSLHHSSQPSDASNTYSTDFPANPSIYQQYEGAQNSASKADYAPTRQRYQAAEVVPSSMGSRHASLSLSQVKAPDSPTQSPESQSRSTLDRETSKRIKLEDNAAKQPLTAAQKRQNHISSEQRRRNLIKDGFIDLSNAVPSVMGNASKSTILHEAIALINKNNARINDLQQMIDRTKWKKEGA